MTNIHELTKDMLTKDNCQKLNSIVIGFYALHSPFNNYNQTEFTGTSENFCCGEQYIQAGKAPKCENNITSPLVIKPVNTYENLNQMSKTSNHRHASMKQFNLDCYVSTSRMNIVSKCY